MKRTLSMLLACLLLIGMLPVNAFAEELEIQPVEEGITIVEEAAVETVPETEAAAEVEPVPETEATEAVETAPETEVTETEAAETEAAETEVPETQAAEAAQVPEAEFVLTGESSGMLSVTQVSEDQLPTLHPDAGAMDVGDHVMNEAEPNDAMNVADTIYHDYTVNGTLPSTSDADYFKFTFSGSKEVFIVAVANRSNMRMRVGNSSGSVIGSTDNGEYTTSGNYGYNLYGTLSGGTYYLALDSTSNCSYTFYITIGSASSSSSYTVTYNANGGTGAPSSQTTTGTVTLSSAIPTRTGYTFLGWATSSSATSASYYPGRSYTVSGNVTLYAVWQAATSIPATVSDSNYSATISFAGGYKMYSYRPTTAKELTFESSGSGDTQIYIYNSSGSQVAYDDDSSNSGNNFKLTYNFSANSTYYIKVKYYSTGTGTFSFNVKSETPSGSFTLTYYVNGGSASAGNSATQTTADDGSATVPLLSTFGPTRTGYTFLGYATSSSATSATYLPGVRYTFTGNTALYAVWQAATVIPADVSNSSFAASIAFKGGYKIYSFRPTAAREVEFESSGSQDTYIHILNSSGTQLTSNDDGSSSGSNFKLRYSFSANTTYYIKVRYYSEDTTGTINFTAKSVGAPYTIIYNANGAAGVSVPSNQTTSTSGALALSDTVLNRTGYTFLGWATSSSATTATHLPGRSYTFAANTTLYAVWQAATVIPADVTNSNFSAAVAFAGGYQMYSYRPTTSRQLTFESSVSQDVAVEVFNSSGTRLATDDDSGVDSNFKLTYTFDANTQYYIKVRYLNGSTVTGTITFNVKSSVTTYTVTYHPNDGSNVTRYDVVSNPFTVVEEIPEREGYTFLGWATSATATSATYLPGQSYPITADLNLYAVWEEEEEEEPTNANIKVSTPTGLAGRQVAVTIALENNPGIASMQLTVGYDEDVLTLVSVTDGAHLGTAVHSDNLAANPYTLTWANDLATENFTYNGDIVTLTFLVAEDAEEGQTPVTVSYDYDNYEIFDVDGEKVRFNTENGYVNVTNVVIGDVNGDGNVNNQDRMILTRYLAKWTGYGEDSINAAASDVNADGRVNNQDRMILTRYLAKWTGYDELPYTE